MVNLSKLKTLVESLVPYPCGSGYAGHGAAYNNASAQGAEHVAGLWSVNMKYACPQLQAQVQALRLRNVAKPAPVMCNGRQESALLGAINVREVLCRDKCLLKE